MKVLFAAAALWTTAAFAYGPWLDKIPLGGVERGDVVIIAGKGHETTQEVAGVKHPFDDRETVRNFSADVV